MELLERHTQLAELDAALRDAGAGRGGLVLVTGEAGAGKTALVERFAQDHAAGRRVLWGLCDDLLTPRPLGPFRDMATQVGGDLERAAQSGPLEELLDAVRGELDRPPHPAVAVVEDAHWADAATLDALRFLGRRIGRMRAMLVVTFRDDEVPADHSLRVALGAVPSHDTRRVRLAPLSREAVARLAGRPDVDELYELTGGNPFFVREVLATSATQVPLSVQDAVMARVRRLGAAGFECVETVSAIPSRAERWLLDGCKVSGGVDEAARLGVLRVDGDAASFTHELTRRAVEQSLEPGRRQQVNAAILEVLADRDIEPARVVHHAVRAGAGAAVARFAPLAARRAAAADAHREAADHFQQALGERDRFDAAEVADLLDEYARECHLAGRHAVARTAVIEAAGSHERRSDLHRLGASLSLLSDVCWHLGQGDEAEAASTRAIAALEQLPPSRELALAYSQKAKLAMVDRRASEAIDWGDAAADLARRLGDTDTLAHALITVGNARWMVPPFDESALVEGLGLALDEGLSHAAARAYNNLAAGHINRGEYAKAKPYLDDGMALCEKHDLNSPYNLMSANRADWNLQQGRWADAEYDLVRPLESEDVSRITALCVLGLLRARRGDPDAEPTLREAERLADTSGSLQSILPIAAARAELAWLDGDHEAAADIAARALDRAAGYDGRWASELTFWLRRSGGRSPGDTGDPGAVSDTGAVSGRAGEVGEAYWLQMAGRWREAAAQWAAMGRPYEQADALADAPDAGPLLEALRILDRLGGVRRAATVRRRLADMGVTSVPRGPTQATRASVAGLTARQTEVLGLLAKDLTYQQIADRLHLSVKTVDHHATAVRLKLDVNTRADAVAAARRLGVLNLGDGEATA